MRDKWFFPAAGGFAALIVIVSLLPGLGNLPSGPVTGNGKNYDRITVAGDYLNKIVAGGDAITELVRGEDGQRLLYIEAEAGALRLEADAGPHFKLASDMELQYAGQRIRCTVRVRPADDRGALQVALEYSVGREGDSGWQLLDLQPGFSDVSFIYDVPELRGEQGFDYFGIRPVVPQKARAILVERVTFERLGPVPEKEEEPEPTTPEQVGGERLPEGGEAITTENDAPDPETL